MPDWETVRAISSHEQRLTIIEEYLFKKKKKNKEENEESEAKLVRE